MMTRKHASRPRAGIIAAAAISAALIAASCAGGPAPAPEATAQAPEAVAAAPAASPARGLPSEPVSTWKLPAETGKFMRANLPTIETRTLANGVKLIVKKNPANRVYSMKVV